MSNPMFRQAAVEALAAPEQLGQLVKITRPRAWIALWALILLLAAVLAWSVLGSLPTRISGRGVLIHDGGTFNVVADGSGMLVGLKPLPVGAQLRRGEVLGQIVNPVLESQVAAAEAYLASLAQERGPGAEARREHARTELRRLHFETALKTPLTSERDGEVIEVMAMNGDTVKAGEPVMSVEYGETPLRAVIYVPSASGRRVQPGMMAEISPATSRRERHGYMVGRVRAVSKYPATEAGMLALLPNAGLVHELAPDGSPTAIEVDLIRAPAARSGYRWSSPAGGALDVTSGTLATASFVVETRRPLALAFPMLDRNR